MPEKEIGVVTHFYDRAMVAVLKLSDSVAVGDRVKFIKGDHEFEETVESMQVEHKEIKSGKAGEEVAIKVKEPAKQGAKVFKVE